jgi:ABC-type sugar transport system ATPase subunit
VALGRAMVREPQAFLFDEPLSNLDPALRVQARTELLRLQRRLATTAVYVTHDQEEAMTLGTRVAVMRDGAIEQLAPPLELYDAPVNTFVAQFIGQPPMNVLAATAAAFEAAPGTRIGIRPHDVALGADGPLRGIVDVVERRGHDAVVHLRLRLPGDPVIAAITSSEPPAAGSEVGVRLVPERVHLFGADGRRQPGPAVP